MIIKKNNDSRCQLNKILLNTNNIVWSIFRESFGLILPCVNQSFSRNPSDSYINELLLSVLHFHSTLY